MILQWFHLCSSIPAMVTSCFHCHCKIIRPSECRYEQWHKDRDHCLCPLQDISRFKICPSCDLCFHDLIRLFQKDWNKAESDRHHHCNLMHRNMDPVQRMKQLFDSVCQAVRGGRKCHDGRSHHQKDQSHRHKNACPQTALRDCKDSIMKEDISTPRKEQVHQHCKKQQDHNGFQSSDNKFYRHF